MVLPVRCVQHLYLPRQFATGAEENLDDAKRINIACRPCGSLWGNAEGEQQMGVVDCTGDLLFGLRCGLACSSLREDDANQTLLLDDVFLSICIGCFGNLFASDASSRSGLSSHAFR